MNDRQLEKLAEFIAAGIDCVVPVTLDNFGYEISPAAEVVSLDEVQAEVGRLQTRHELTGWGRWQKTVTDSEGQLYFFARSYTWDECMNVEGTNSEVDREILVETAAREITRLGRVGRELREVKATAWNLRKLLEHVLSRYDNLRAEVGMCEEWSDDGETGNARDAVRGVMCSDRSPRRPPCQHRILTVHAEGETCDRCGARWTWDEINNDMREQQTASDSEHAAYEYGRGELAARDGY